MKDKCGVVGICFKDNLKKASYSIYYSLLSLQHRGQESTGIVTRKKSDFFYEKGMGLVNEIFTFDSLDSLDGNAGIGHVRYSTMGASQIENAQPFVVRHSSGTLAIGHNGNIVNAEELRHALKASGSIFVSTSDTEIIAHLIIREHLKGKDFVESIAEVMKKLVGSYSLVILTDDAIYAVRDPLGIRPLVLGNLDGKGYIVASETVALDVVGARYVKNIKPGEILEINSHCSLNSHRVIKLPRKAYCMFEYVYFARPDSVLNDVPVYKVREKIGEFIGLNDDIEADVVSPIPDSAIPSALGYSRASKIPYRETLIRNRYVGRTFILPEQKARELAVKLKLNPIAGEVKGKKIVLFDDSIVRGTTSSRIIKLLKGAGAKEVHMRVGCPPIKSRCNLGINMPTNEELIANNKTVEEIREEIGADSLSYLSIENLIEAIGMEDSNLCTGCLTGKYPIDISKYEQVKLPVYLKK